MKALLGLYPRAWRDRYAEEMEALLEERASGPFDALDLILGAFDAHLHRRGLGRGALAEKGLTMTVHIAAAAALIGAVGWLATLFFGVTTSSEEGNSSALFVLLLSTLVLVVAMAGLSVMQHRRNPRAIWAAFGLTAAGSALMGTGLIGEITVGDRPFLAGLEPWWFVILGMMLALVGSFIFGVVTYVSRVLGRPAAAMLAISTVAQFFGVMGASPYLLFAGAVIFAVSWMLLASDAERSNTIRASSQPA